MPDTLQTTRTTLVESVPVESPAWAIRLEAKVDVALAQHGARLDNHANDLRDHEARLRTQEAREYVTPFVAQDHETRIREVESRKTVSPQALWTVVLGGVTGAAGLFGIVSQLIAK